ncbi:MAG: hypothetical protein FJZ00_00480 [Candidatus Sericytochromatia bacterium]|uniref:HTH luxR-type domain-containing protein n=1 Tax=Candidatus Tanganyikabacteria bacterium TaxID=2961651 RepID=A0A937X084_9BACT|nr:hypothetical protein [Candidatus Tanganyikabacteria bacterium]
MLLLLDGLNGEGIGERLGIAASTVKNILSVIYGKLCVRGRPEAIALLSQSLRRP